MIDDYPLIGRLFRALPSVFGAPLLAMVLVAFVVGAAGLASVEYGSPWALALLPVAILLSLQRRITGANQLAVPKIPTDARRWSVRGLLAPIPDVLQIAGLCLLIIALARPQITRKDELEESPGLDIMLVIDTSQSMENPDMRTGMGTFAARIEVAKAVSSAFVRDRPHDRIGVVLFGEAAFTFVPLTLDHDAVLDGIDQIELGMAGGHGTAVGQGLAVAAKRMKELEAPERVVILVTDGRSNQGTIQPHEAAVAAHAVGVRVFTIGVGATPGGMGFSSDGVDEPMMRDIAAICEGQYFRASDLAQMEKVYEQIDQLAPSPAKVKQLIQHDDRFASALCPALAMLFTAFLLWATFLRRGP